MRVSKLAKLYMVVVIVIVVFGVYPSSSFAQETPTTEDTASADGLPPTPYVNAGKGYKIGGQIVVAEPGIGNFAVGNGALGSNTTGVDNTAAGPGALAGNTSGMDNTADGAQALASNTTGSANTAIGLDALYFGTTTNGNTAIGFGALGGYPVGAYNIAIGYNAATNVSGGDNIEIGSLGSGDDNGVIRIGCTLNCPEPFLSYTSFFAAGIAGATLPVANEPLVCVDPSTGQLGTVNCASNGTPSAQLEMMGQRIESLQKQNQELQQRLSHLESIIAKQ